MRARENEDWSYLEDKDLLKLWLISKSFTKLADKHERSRSSIKKRLIQLVKEG